MKPIVVGALAAVTVCAALVQPAAGEDRLLRAPYITKSGATVDKPGEPQASGPTKMDRGIERQDNKIDHSICKGC